MIGAHQENEMMLFLRVSNNRVATLLNFANIFLVTCASIESDTDTVDTYLTDWTEKKIAKRRDIACHTFFTTFHSLQPFFPSFYCYQIRALLPLEIEFRLMFFLLQSFFSAFFLKKEIETVTFFLMFQERVRQGCSRAKAITLI